jgi:hypothetical protein
VWKGKIANYVGMNNGLEGNMMSQQTLKTSEKQLYKKMWLLENKQSSIFCMCENSWLVVRQKMKPESAHESTGEVFDSDRYLVLNVQGSDVD